jgi:uncharacterized protein involved in exopolysaccharide biosynthesis
VALAIELNGRVSVEESQASQDFIKKQLEDRRLQLEDVERRLVAFKARAQIDRRREDVRALLDARRELVDLEGRLAAERGRLAAATSELAQRTRTPSTRRGANPVAAMPGAGTSSNERPRDGPPPRSTPEDRQTAQPDTSPVVQEDGDDDSSSRNTRAQALLANRLGGLTDSVYEILDYEAANSRVRLAGLESRRRELSGALGLTKPALKQLTELYEYEIEQARLEAEYDLSIKLYQGLLTRLEQGRFAVAGVSSGFKLMDPAVVAAKLSRPSSRLAAMLGAAAGLGFGILVAFVLNFFRVPSRGDR